MICPHSRWWAAHIQISTDGSISYTEYAPAAVSVSLVGEFSWSSTARPEAADVKTALMRLIAPYAEYTALKWVFGRAKSRLWQVADRP